MKQVEVISIGAVNYDIIAFVSKFPEAEEKINSTRYQEYGVAGVAVDCLTQVSRLGLSCGHIGKMGMDYYADHIRTDLEEEGIDTTFCINVPEMRTGVAWVLVNSDNADRCHIIHPASAGNFDWDELKGMKDYICSAKAVHMEMLQMPMEPLYEVAKLCREHGVITSMDIDIAPHYLYEYGYATPELFMATCPQIDLLKLCSAAIPELTEQKDMVEAAKELYEKLQPTVLILTLGGAGCVVAHKVGECTEVIVVPAFDGKDIIDTTGSGDAFQGGFIYGYLKNYPLKKTAQLANACGYLAAKKIGARGSADKETLNRFMVEHGCGPL
ncbi:carbohydrate kinase family protein [Faecalicatena contorta]|uniref:carbohydrate kinase family protein n=1 Tax=Faecalicatena contorta TaxID=39482 RepID=UPI001F43B2F4|nr:carbohydrate kinase family protein [Faecalicatena contorta]